MESDERTQESTSTATISENDLQIELPPLGEGGFGLVYKVNHKDWGPVTYKKLISSYLDTHTRESLEKGVNSHKDLSHPNIIKFLAMVFDIGTPEKPGSCGIVMEYMEHGDLRTYLRERDLNYGEKKLLISNVANGVCYLHSLDPPLIHGDLKIENVLIDSEKKAKIADFDLSQWKTYSTMISKNILSKGTLTHIPPEHWNNSKLRKSEKFDVYSFGILIWEILTGEKPFENAKPANLIEVWVSKGQRPDMNLINDDVPSNIISLMETCWSQDPEERPDFEEINIQLESDGGFENPRKRKQLSESILRSERKRFKKNILSGKHNSLPIITSEILGNASGVGVQLIHRMEIKTEQQEVGGLAWMDNKIFVTFWNSENLLVFNDSSPFKQVDKIPLKQLKTVANMVAIESARSIFVSCKYQKSIWKVKMPEKQVSEWPVEGGETQMLSVTPDDELLLTVHMDWNNGRGYCLDVYDPSDLHRLKRVMLPIDSMKSPGTSLDIHHALILASGNIITSYQETRRVRKYQYIDPTDPNPPDSDEEEDLNSYFLCELSLDGKNVRKKQMHSDLPTFIYLSQDKEGHLFVADCTNNTIFEMSSEVKFQLLTEEQHDIRGLGRICVGDNQRMIVAHAEKN